MTKQQLEQFVNVQYNNRESWLIKSKEFQDSAIIVETIDPILATIMRRVGLAIQQYEDRILARQQELTLEKIDASFDAQTEDDHLIEQLFARVTENKS